MCIRDSAYPYWIAHYYVDSVKYQGKWDFWQHTDCLLYTSIMETEKLSPYEATKKAMNGLASALIATSLVLAAVFVPVSFLSGITRCV